MEKENRLNKIAWILLLLYFIDTTVDGTGRIIEFGFISMQMILFAAAFIVTLPIVIKKYKELISDSCIVAVLIFAVFVIFSAFVGFVKGNKLSYIRTDITSILGLALLPGTLAVITNNDKLHKTLEILFWVASVFSFVIVVLYCCCPFIDKDIMGLFNSIYSSNYSIDGINGSFAYFRVNALMIVFSVYGVFLLKNSKINVWLIYAAEASLIMLILLSTERSSCLGLLVALLIVLAINPKDIKHYLKSGLITTAVICVFIGIASLTRQELALIPTVFGKFSATQVGNSLSYDEYAEMLSNENAVAEAAENNANKPFIPAEVFDNPEYPAEREDVLIAVGADNFRKITIQRHEYYIKKSPMLGTGLGFDLHLNNGGKTEYMYLDFLMKLGVFGFLAFLAAYFTPVIMCFKHNARRLPTESLSLLAGYLGIAVTSYFEPYLTNPMGIIILCLLAAGISIEMKNDKQEQTKT